MAFDFNGNIPRNIKFNNKYVEKLKYNNQIVWEKKLPDEYQEVAYLETLGGEAGTSFPYIDTRFKPNQDTRIIYDHQLTSVTNKYHFGVQRQYGIWYRYGGSMQSATDFRYLTYYGQNPDSLTTRWGNINTNRHILDANKNIWKFDGTTIATYTYNNFQSIDNIYLFTINRANYADAALTSTPCKLFSCKIYDNGNLVRNFIPCYRKIDNEAGLYDVVNNEFYLNVGGGKFLVGPDIVNLPSEYQQVEYIETTGSQYINTDYLPNNNTKIELTYMLTAMPTQIIFGSRADADSSRAYNGVFITHRSANAKVAWGKGANSNLEIQGYNDINTQYTAFFDKNKVYFNDNLVYNFSDIIWEGNYPIFVGCVNTKGRAEYYAKCKYYNFKIWNENVLERYLIPCYRKLDNVAGFYDLVNDNFYTNAGTGEFIVGEDI